MKEHIIINKDRTVVVPDSVRKIGIQYDHKVNTLTFDCPRYADDNQSIDLSRMAIYINFSRNDKTKGSIAATNIFVDPDDPEIMHFDFIITRSVTLVNGSIICLVCAKSTDAEGVEVNHWNSELFNKLSVGEGMEAEEELTEEEIDYITSLLQEINTTHAEVADIDTRVEDLEFNQEKQGTVSEVNLEAMTWTDGSYITGSGTIGSSSGYGISELVTLPKMSTLILDATGYQSDVAMIAKSDHTPLVTSVDGKTHYEYYTDEEIQVYISCKTTVAKSAKIVRNVAETLSDLERENSELKGDLDDILRIETEDIQPVMTNDNYFFNTSGTTIASDDTTILKKSYGRKKSDNWLISVESGEVYCITSFGNNAGAYAFVSEIKTTYADVIARYHVNEQCLKEYVTVPQEAKYLVVNNFDIGNGMVKKVLYEDPIVYESRIKPIEDKLNSCIVQYKEVSEPYSGSNESLYVYIPSRVGYVRLVFCHSISESENANSWRFYQLSSVADDMETLRFKVTQLGEMEMALRLKDADDFVGGYTHGDEVGDNISVFVDGVKCELSELLNKTEFNELRIITTSTLYSPFDHTTEIATHGKEFVITKDDVVLNQSVNWSTSQTLVTSYMTMLCAIRGNDTVSALQITDTYYDDGNFEQFDISTGGFTTYPNNYKTGLKEFVLSSKKSGVYLHTMLEVFPELTGGGSFVYNGENTYNKLYCAICGGFANSKPYTTTVGERWKTKTRFKFSISKGTDID